MGKKITNNPIIWLTLILVIAFFLRLINLGAEPYWGDEVLSVDIVRHYQGDIRGMLNYLNFVEVHPPLYYLLLQFWGNLFGFSEFGVRFLSLIFGLGVIILTSLLVRKVFKSERLSLLAALIIAVLPMQIEFSQEARPYIVYTFLALLATFLYWQYWQKPRIILSVAYILTSLAGLYLHYSYVFFAASLAIFWLSDIFINSQKAKWGKLLLNWLVVHFFIFILYFPQLIILLFKSSLSNFRIFGLPQTVGFGRKVAFFESVMNQLIWLSKNTQVTVLEVFAIAIFKILLITGVIWLIFNKQSKVKKLEIRNFRPILLIIFLVFLPIIFFLFSPQGTYYSQIYERHVLPSSVFLGILLAYLLYNFPFKIRLALIILFLISLMNFVILIVGNDEVWDPFHRLKIFANHINYLYRPGDLVLVTSSSARTNLNHFLRPEISAQGIHPVSLLDYQQDILASRETLGLIENESQMRSDYYKGVLVSPGEVNRKLDYLANRYKPQRIWVVLDESPEVESWFVKNNWKKAMAPIGKLFPVELYAKR